MQFFDRETGWENGVIVQISAQLFHLLPRNTHWSIEVETFDQYVKPEDECQWDSEATCIHGLGMPSPEIENASNINEVWLEFCEYIILHGYGVLPKLQTQLCPCQPKSNSFLIPYLSYNTTNHAS